MPDPTHLEMVIDETYLPFTPTELLDHFAPVAGGDDLNPDRYLTYYLTSQRNRRAFQGTGDGMTVSDPQVVRLGHQMEKDERFWVVAALLGVFRDPLDRTTRLADLLRTCEGLELPIGRFSTWEEALGGHQELYFEANLPSPSLYRRFLEKHLEERTLPIPNIRDAARHRGERLEGSTKVDALLIAPETGFAVLFEAKVLADMSTQIEFDVLRNQMVRNIDVMLDRNDDLQWPLNQRNPETTCFVLLTPQIFKKHRESRLYGLLFDRYRDLELLHDHLIYRNEATLATVPSRLGWLTFEDCNKIQPDSCRWLNS